MTHKMPCQTGHLATAAELQQMWNIKTNNNPDDPDERILDIFETRYNSPYYWAAEDYTSDSEIA